jgi:hypothetical protein
MRFGPVRSGRRTPTCSRSQDDLVGQNGYRLSLGFKLKLGLGLGLNVKLGFGFGVKLGGDDFS